MIVIIVKFDLDYYLVLVTITLFSLLNNRFFSTSLFIQVRLIESNVNNMIEA